MEIRQMHQRARRFYEKLGFIHDGGTISCEIGGKALTEARYILMNHKWE